MIFTTNTFSSIDDPQSSDIEALQTDTMRFLAILAICLMVIFALVQAVPLNPNTGKPRFIDGIDKRIKELERRINNLSKQEQLLREKIQQSHKELAKLNVYKDQVVKELNNVKHSLDEEHVRLNYLKDDIKKKQEAKKFAENEITKSHKRIDERNRALDKIKKKINNLKKNLKIDTERGQESQRVGFSFLFESENALKQLIRIKRVSFYAGLKNRYWKLEINQGGIQFKEIEGIFMLKRIIEETVPDGFREAISKKVASFSKGNIKYYVTLPKDITQSMSQKMRGVKGGTLVITEDGKVILK